MPNSQNGWPVLNASDSRLRNAVLPTYPGTVQVRDGSACMILLHYALWYLEKIEPIGIGQRDDWWASVRKIAGSTVYSNHASATAQDLNALKHPRGVSGTFTRVQRMRIRYRLRVVYQGCLASGIWWNNPDDMHTEIAKPLADCEKVARRLCNTKRGKRILDANPGLRNVIFS